MLLNKKFYNLNQNLFEKVIYNIYHIIRASQVLYNQDAFNLKTYFVQGLELKIIVNDMINKYVIHKFN